LVVVDVVAAAAAAVVAFALHLAAGFTCHTMPN
jgi:hypothetical protein